MTSDEKFAYWLEHAEYDLQSAETMFTGGRWVYVIFMCQQALEKLVKGLYLLYVDDNIPRIHNISNLILRFENKLPAPVTREKKELFNRLSSYYLNTRYPEYKETLSSITDKDTAKLLLGQSREVFQWLLTLKPSIEV